MYDELEDIFRLLITKNCSQLNVFCVLTLKKKLLENKLIHNCKVKNYN